MFSCHSVAIALQHAMQRIWPLSFWLTLIAITAASLSPIQHLPAAAFDIWDKAQHAAGFALLTGLGLKAHAWRRWHWMIGLATYGAAIEALQQLSGWRTGDPLDWLADCLGTGTVLIANWLWRRQADAPRCA